MEHHYLNWTNLITIYTRARINGGYSWDNGSHTAWHSGEIKVTFVYFTLYHLRHRERRFFLMQNAYTRRWQEHHDDGVFFPSVSLFVNTAWKCQPTSFGWQRVQHVYSLVFHSFARTIARGHLRVSCWRHISKKESVKRLLCHRWSESR